MPEFAPEDLDTSGGQLPTTNLPTTLSPQDAEARVRFHAQKQGLDPDFVARLAHTESSFNPSAVGPKTKSGENAVGVMQLMPKTAADLGVDRNNPEQNIEGGVRYLKQLMDKYKDPQKAAAAYNWGPENVDSGKDYPSETQAYLGRIFGGSARSAPSLGKMFAPGELDAPSQAPINISKTVQGDLPFFPGAQDTFENIKDAGAAARPYTPYLAAGIAGMVVPPPFNIPAAVGVAGLTRGAEQSGLVQSGQTTPEQAQRAVLENMKSEAQGQFIGGALGVIAPTLARWIYAKRAGIDPTKAVQVEAIKDMVEREIPAGVGRTAKIKELKDAANEGLNEVYNKYGQPSTSQVPGIVPAAQAGAQATTLGNVVNKRTLFGDIAQHYITERTAPIAEVEAALGKDGAAIVDKVRKGLPIKPGELEAAYNTTEKGNAFGNFFGGSEEQIALNDARTIKQNIQKKIPYGAETEGAMQARKVVSAHVVQNIANAIPSQTDKAKFLQHSGELERLINIEDLPGFKKLSTKLLSMYMAVPLASAVAGGATGYYSHQDPLAAAGRAGLAGAMVASPPSIAHFLNTVFGRQAIAGGIAAGQDQGGGTPDFQLSPEDIRKLRESLNANQQ